MARPLLRSLCVALCACALLAGTAEVSAAEPTRPRLTQGGGSTDRGIVTAGADGAEYALPGGAVVRLAPGSAFKLFGGSQDLMLRPGAAKIPTWSVFLRSGRLDVSVPVGARPSAVLVSTNKKSGGIALGGRMTVIADAAGVLVVNRSGEALAGVADRWRPLGAGVQRAFTADASGASATSPMVATPVLSSLPPILFAYEERVKLAPVEWAPVAGAASYLVELEDAAGAVQRRQTSHARLDGAFEPLRPGAYRLHVTAYDARGIESSRSAALPLRVIGVELPAGAYVEDGTVKLAPGQQVKLSAVDGVQMSYTGKGSFVASASSFGVFRDEPRTVWLRTEGEPQALKLAPRRFSAHIELGPKRAVWPRDTVTVSIRLKDGAKPLPSWLKATPSVSIGLTPVDVRWRTEQDTLRATVPVPSTKGPWVLRVEVLDQYRIPLGYEFLEIAEIPNRSAAHPASTP